MAEEKSVIKIFGERLKKLREDRNESQEQLASALFLSRSAIGYYENAKRCAEIDTLNKVAKHFDVSINYLIGESDATKIGNQSICEQTRLSEAAIEQLLKFRAQSEKTNGYSLFDLLDKVLSMGILMEIMEVMKQYIDSVPESRKANKEEYQRLLSGGDSKDKTDLRRDLFGNYKNNLDFIMWQASRDFEIILHNLEREINKDVKGDSNNGNS